MLRDTASKVQLTQENIENFFRLVAEASYDKKNPLAGSLEILRRVYFEYLRVCLEASAEKPKFLKEKQTYLVSFLKSIGKNDFFKDILNMVDLIKNDISENGAQLEKWSEEVREDMMRNVRYIQERCQLTVEKAPKMYPDKMEIGLSHTELTGLKYSAHYQTGSVAVNLNATGLEHFNKKEWESAIHYFERSIEAEIEISREAKTFVNQANLTIYKRNVVNGYNQWGIEFFNRREYQLAIDTFKKVLEAQDKIQDPSREDKATRVSVYRKMAFSYYSIGLQCADEREGVAYFQKAIDEQNKVFEENREELDQTNLSAFYRCLGQAFCTMANAEYVARNDDAVIDSFKKAFVAFDNVSHLQEVDIDCIADGSRRLAMTFSHRASVHFLAGRYAETRADYIAAIAYFKKIPMDKRIPGDKIQEQLYVGNLRNLEQILGLERSLAGKRHALFTSERGGDMPDDDLGKRRRLGH